MLGKRFFIGISLLVILTLVAGPALSLAAQQEQAAPANAAPPVGAVAEKSASSNPLMFIENVGQFGEGPLFQAHLRGATLWLAQDALWITVMETPLRHGLRPPTFGSDRMLRLLDGGLESGKAEPRRGVNLKLTLAGANPQPKLEGFSRLETHVSYFFGDDPNAWRPDVPVWGGVRYKDVYPGIDLELTSEGGRLVQRMVAAAGADLSMVRLQVEGAKAVAVEGTRLRLTTDIGDLRLPLFEAAGAAVAPQVKGNVIVSPFAVPGAALAAAELTTIATANNNLTELLFSTFLGGSVEDIPESVAVGTGGVVYVAGYTSSSNFPVKAGSFDTSYGGRYDAFVVKLNSIGSTLIYATYLGSTYDDYGLDIAVDGTGAAYVTGQTFSSGFPLTVGCFDGSFAGSSEGFVLKLNANGTGLVYSSFLGGSADDEGRSIAVDATGYAYVTGGTNSNTNFPTTVGAYDRTYNGGIYDAFVTKVMTDGKSLAYSTFLGGSVKDQGIGITVGADGMVYVTGETWSTNFPTSVTAFDRGHNGSADVFVAKLNTLEVANPPAALVYSTFLGGSGDDHGHSIAVNASGIAYVAGRTRSANFPTTPASYDPTANGDWDGFVTKLNASGSGLLYSTYLGGSAMDDAIGIDIDSSGSAYVAGATLSSNFPMPGPAFDRTFNGVWDAYVLKLNAAGSALTQGSFLGGTAADAPYALDVDAGGSVYVVGEASSTDFPTTPGAYDGTHNGSIDGFVARLAMRPRYIQRVNAGGPDYTDSNGVQWAADKAFVAGSWGYVGGTASSTTAPIAGTTDDPLYQTDRVWPAQSTGTYRFTVANGQYEVTLKFAETVWTTGGKRKFNVKIEGTVVLSNYDIFLDAGTKDKAAPDKTFVATVSDGELTIEFVALPNFGQPKVNAIEVRQTTTVRVNAGGPAYRDGGSNLWSADKAFVAGGWGYVGASTGTYSTTQPIANTTDDKLYQSERNNMTEYQFTVPRGTYTVTVRFAEINPAIAGGGRVFDVKMENFIKLANFDVFTVAGGTYKAVDRTFVVIVTDGTLNIAFVNKVGVAKVSAILVRMR